MVNIKRYFIEQGIKKVAVDEYLASKFWRAGYAGVDIIRTPLGTRVIIYALRPGLIIGRKGQTLKTIQTVLEKLFGIENPQITVVEAENPDLNARVVAFNIAMALERGVHFRRAGFIALRRVMAAGALGCEIVISGKLVAERARYEKLKAGKVYKSGEQSLKLIDRAVAHVLLKPGIFGVEVLITKPGLTSDHVEIVSPATEVKEQKT
ncbi:30S ribosomal protein S3 [Ignisphaera sp. 4213-co]|uniref:Small ribosomal subunit protein uS3 n=1 Tax=Ignisphaera cupida TaxID=3050454 RepID=A0ABD4Z754_9CREN|nr:30S ribosomal protein S3 [Ignisphaera sp. 4213-co]MDK6027953.1 30S ribosomal protein S3 [Ignisphaera sp. 4213-co]